MSRSPSILDYVNKTISLLLSLSLHNHGKQGTDTWQIIYIN